MPEFFFGFLVGLAMLSMIFFVFVAKSYKENRSLEEDEIIPLS